MQKLKVAKEVEKKIKVKYNSSTKELVFGLGSIFPSSMVKVMNKALSRGEFVIDSGEFIIFMGV